MKTTASTNHSIATSEYHKHLPGETPMHIAKNPISGLTLDVYHFPRINEGITPPSIPDYGIAYVTQVPTIKAYYGYHYEKWRRFVNHKPNLLQFVNKDTPMSWQWRIPSDQTPPRTIGLYLDSEKLESIAYEVFGHDAGDVELQSSVDVEDSLIKQIVLTLESESLAGSNLDTLYAQTAAQFLAVHLLKNHCKFKTAGNDAQHGLSAAHLNKVCEYIESNIDSVISLRRLSLLCGLSPYYFIRQFHATTGKPPHQYLIERRIERAKELLQNSHLSILEIAVRIGYQSQSHFSSLFKRYHGITPTEYRRNAN